MYEDVCALKQQRRNILFSFLLFPSIGLVSNLWIISLSCISTCLDIISKRAARAALGEARRASRRSGATGHGLHIRAVYSKIFPEDVLISLLLQNGCMEVEGFGTRVKEPTHLVGVRPLEHIHPADGSLWGWFHHHLPGRFWRGQIGSHFPTFAVHKVIPGTRVTPELSNE